MNQLEPARFAAPSGLDWELDAIIGRRAEQQDTARAYLGVAEGRPALLVIVADGMGGAVGGRLASTVAASAFEKRFQAAPGQNVQARLTAALEAANSAIAEEIRRDHALEGMGCTLVAVVTDGREATWISVGDSLLLLATPPAKLDRLNDDHSMAAVLDRAARQGEISRLEAETSHQRHMLRSALTGRNIALIDRGSIRLEPGTRLLMATDGILTLPYEQICRLAGETPSAAALTDAILHAVTAQMPDDQDNLTVAVVDIPSSPNHRGTLRTAKTPTWAKLSIGLGSAIFLAAMAALAVLNWQTIQGLWAKPAPLAQARAPEPPATATPLRGSAPMATRRQSPHVKPIFPTESSPNSQAHGSHKPTEVQTRPDQGHAAHVSAPQKPKAASSPGGSKATNLPDIPRPTGASELAKPGTLNDAAKPAVSSNSGGT